MKKVLLIVLLTAGLMADVYIGLGGSFSNADDEQVRCRISPLVIGGIDIPNKFMKLSIEGRFANGMNNDYQSTDIFIKAGTKSFYALLGYGKTDYPNDTYISPRYGVGYRYEKKKNLTLFIDAVHRQKEDDCTATIGFVYHIKK